MLWRSQGCRHGSVVVRVRGLRLDVTRAILHGYTSWPIHDSVAEAVVSCQSFADNGAGRTCSISVFIFFGHQAIGVVSRIRFRLQTAWPLHVVRSLGDWQDYRRRIAIGCRTVVTRERTLQEGAASQTLVRLTFCFVGSLKVHNGLVSHWV